LSVKTLISAVPETIQLTCISIFNEKAPHGSLHEGLGSLFDRGPTAQSGVHVPNSEADGHPEVHGRTTTGSIVGETNHELIIAIRPEEFAGMASGVEHTPRPRNEVAGYEWKVKGRVTIAKKP
jgi:hypothetical protein